jgi:succinate dehydrogenase hydrophobic anchor subunit
MFRKISEMKPKHQTVFAIIIAFAVISFWRGIWGLMDEYLIPENRPLSLFISLVLGLAILIATHYVTKAIEIE